MIEPLVLPAACQHFRRRVGEGQHALDLVHVVQPDAAVLRNREADAQHRSGDVAFIGRLLEIGLHPVDVEARGKRPVEEIGLGEAELILFLDLGYLHAGAQVLAAPEHVDFGIAELADQLAGRGIAQAQRQRAGGLLRHIDRDVGAVGLAARIVLDIDFLEEAQAPDAGARAVDQHPVESVAFHQAEFPADHLVEGSRVAGNIDLLDIDARTLQYLEAHIDGMGIAVALDARMHLGEGIALGARRVGQGVDRLLHLLLGIDLAGLDGDQRQKLGRRQFPDLGLDRHLAEFVSGAFVHREGDVEGAAVRGQFGHRADHPEIGVAVIGVIAAQLLAVELQPVGIVIVVAGEEFPPAAFLGGDLAAQGVGIVDLVADEIDARHPGGRPVGDREDQVDAVLRPLDDLGIDPRGEFAVAAIELDDALDIGLHLGAGEHGARLDLDFLGEVLVADLAVALEHHLVDDGILRDPDGQGAVGEAGGDVGEQAGGIERLHRRVGGGGIEIVAFADGDVGQHGARLDALVAGHHDVLDHALGRLRRRIGGGGGIGGGCRGGIVGIDQVGIGRLGVQLLGALLRAGPQLGVGRRRGQRQGKDRRGRAQQPAFEGIGPHPSSGKLVLGRRNLRSADVTEKIQRARS